MDNEGTWFSNSFKHGICFTDSIINDDKYSVNRNRFYSKKSNKDFNSRSEYIKGKNQRWKIRI